MDIFFVKIEKFVFNTLKEGLPGNHYARIKTRFTVTFSIPTVVGVSTIHLYFWGLCAVFVEFVRTDHN